MAIILNETASAAGQGGYGAVMGSKKLKAIVLKGTGTLKIANPDYFMNLLNERKVLGEWVIGSDQRWGRYPLSPAAIREEMEGKHLKKFAGCHGCPFQCMGFYDIPGTGKGAQMCNECWYGWFSGGSSEGAWKGNILSQKLGLNNADLLGITNLIVDGVRRRLFTKEDIAVPFIPIVDYSLHDKYGGKEKHHQFLEALMNGIADGTSPFHQGAGRAAEQFGEQAVDLFNAIFSGWGMRSHHVEGIGAALHWATDTRDPFNSCHDYTQSFGVNKYVAEYFGVPGGYLTPQRRSIYDGAERETVWVQNHQCLKNSLPICNFAAMPHSFFHPPRMTIQIFESKILSAVTGLDVDVDALWEAGERIWNLRRAVMVLRENRRREGDTLSPALFSRLAAGTSEVLAEPIDEERWVEVKDRYYELRGWNVNTGWPARARLEQLGMKDVADRL